MILGHEKYALLYKLYAEDSLDEIRRILHYPFRRYSPFEIAELYDSIDFEMLKVKKEDFIRYAPLWGRLKNRSYPALDSTEISPGAIFHEARTTPRDAKGLLVCFCGAKGELHIPVVRYMLELPADAYDYLVLSPKTLLPSNRLAHYTAGVEGFADSIEDIAARIEREYLSGGYRTSATVGTSMGGFAALDVADRIGAVAGIAINGRMEYLNGAVPIEHLARTPPAKFCVCRTWNPDVKLHALYGMENKRDNESAQRLSMLNRDLKIWPIRGLGDHNPFPLWGANQLLKPFFNGLHQAATASHEKPWEWLEN
jgi:hypothetical protein